MDPHIVFCAFGNVLVDICVEVDYEFLKSKHLKPNRSSEVEKDDIFHEILSKYETISKTTGGSALNTVRIAQWMLNKSEKKCAFFGCIGNDEFGEFVEKEINHSKVIPYLMKHPTMTTGKCAAMVTGDDRTLVAYLGASNSFEESFLMQQRMAQVISNAHLIYVESFFLIHNIETVHYLAQECKRLGKPFLLNLSGAYVCKDYYHYILDILQYIDILFGNEDEARAFAYMTGMKVRRKDDCTTADLAKEFSRMLNDDCKYRTVVITQGSGPVIVVEKGECKEYEVEPVAHIVDTIGGGDAFVGGFLSKLVEGCSIDDCVKCGIYCGREIVQQHGCTIPEHSPEFEVSS